MAKAKKTKKEQPTDVLVAWCIDRSASMGGFEDDTIGGFNAYVKDQQAEPGRMYLSLVLFDHTFQAPIVAMDIKEVPLLDRSTYYIGGNTALYDAVGVTINGVEGWLKNNPAFTGKVLINIWTDGGENASSRWSTYNGGLGAMMAEVQKKQEAGWTFAFLGSGGSAWTQGRQFESFVGVGNTTQVTPTSSGVRMSYAAASGATRSMRAGGSYAANASMAAATTNSATLKNFGVDDVEEALAGTDNKTE